MREYTERLSTVGLPPHSAGVDAKADVFDYTEVIYKRITRHPALDYVSPVTFHNPALRA